MRAQHGDSSRWAAVALSDHAPRTAERPVRDLDWAYHQPLHDAAHVRDLTAFFDERIDVTIDGEHRERPITPWSSGPGS